MSGEFEVVEKTKIKVEDCGCGWSDDGRFLLFTAEAIKVLSKWFVVSGGIVFVFGILIGWRFF